MDWIYLVKDGVPITKPSKFCRLCKDIIRKTEKGLLNCYSISATRSI
ncbi:PocR ligand-binding domain-containing protein [Desulfogranum marinum]